MFELVLKIVLGKLKTLSKFLILLIHYSMYKTLLKKHSHINKHMKSSHFYSKKKLSGMI